MTDTQIDLHAQPLLLTALMDEQSQSYFQELRDRYFPPLRNVVPAHVSLFHNLPAGNRSQIEADLKTSVATASFDLAVTGLKFMGGGVMYTIESAELDSVRKQLAERWQSWLIAQDRQKFKAHVVVQNKVSGDEARRTFKILQDDFKPFSARARGLHLWTYLGGPWRSEGSFLFF